MAKLTMRDYTNPAILKAILPYFLICGFATIAAQAPLLFFINASSPPFWALAVSMLGGMAAFLFYFYLSFSLMFGWVNAITKRLHFRVDRALRKSDLR